MDEYREASSRGNRQHEPSARPGMAPEEEALIQQAYVPILYEDLVGQPGPIGRLAKPRAARRGRHQRPFTPTSPRPMAFELRAQSWPKTIMQVGASQNKLWVPSQTIGLFMMTSAAGDHVYYCHSTQCVQTRSSHNCFTSLCHRRCVAGQEQLGVHYIYAAALPLAVYAAGVQPNGVCCATQSMTHLCFNTHLQLAKRLTDRVHL